MSVVRAALLALLLAACAPTAYPCGPSDVPFDGACLACLGARGSLAACLDPEAAQR